MNDQTKTETKANPKGTAPAPDAPAEAKAEVKPFPLNALTVPRMRPLFAAEGDAGNRWRATAPRETPWEYSLRDEFWASNADRLRFGDTIEVLCDDNSYFVELLVIDADSPGRGVPNKRISVAELRHVDLRAAQRIPQASEYIVKHRGDFMKWCVVRIADDKPIIEKCYDKGEAEEKMRAFLRARGENKKSKAA